MFKIQIVLLFFLLFVRTVVPAADKDYLSGPAIRFTNIEARDSKIFIEGFTFDENFPVKAITYTIDKSPEALNTIEPVDKIYDSKNEKFVISIPFPSNGDWDIYVTNFSPDEAVKILERADEK